MVATFDIFNSNAFTTTSLVQAIEKIPFKPSFLGALGLFIDNPIRTEWAWVEERDGTLNLIQSSPRGAPKPQRTTEKRSARAFKTVRIAKGDHVQASELLNVRQFGSETELEQVMAEVMRRLAGPVGLQQELDLTMENHRLGAVQGVVTDADGSTIINWFTEFGISAPSEIAFDLAGAQAYSTSTALGVLRPFINQNIVRPIIQGAKGLPVQRIWALCGHTAYDQLTNHGEVRTTYLNQVQAQELRDPNAFGMFEFGGVTWVDYRGTDDNSSIAINADKFKFFPQGPGLLSRALSPGESIEDVGTLGKPLYAKVVPDPTTRQEYVDIEVANYPLHICTRPETLLSGRRGS